MVSQSFRSSLSKSDGRLCLHLPPNDKEIKGKLSGEFTLGRLASSFQRHLSHQTGSFHPHQKFMTFFPVGERHFLW